MKTETTTTTYVRRYDDDAWHSLFLLVYFIVMLSVMFQIWNILAPSNFVEKFVSVILILTAFWVYTLTNNHIVKKTVVREVKHG